MKKNVGKYLLLAALLMLAAPLYAQDTDSAPVYDGDPLEGIDLEKMALDGEQYSQLMEDGRVVKFTTDVELQKFAMNLLDSYEVPAGAAVVLNSKTGRVLAFASRRGEEYAARNSIVPLDVSPPAASIFKIVTTSALIEQTDVNLDTSVCYHGGGGSIEQYNLVDNKTADTACRSLKRAFGYSTNAVYAKLFDRNLEPGVLEDYAKKFGFGRELPFDVELPVSKFELPESRLERARTSAGFWHSHMSPLHGAMIAQSLAQKGAMLKPYIVDSVTDAEGNVIYEGTPAFIGRTVEKETAADLLEAMKVTVSAGTARKAFRTGNGGAKVPGGHVAGKTGTLHGKKPFRAYSWFVGVAPAEKPEVAIAVLIVNSPKWRIKSSWTASKILQKYFELKASDK